MLLNAKEINKIILKVFRNVQGNRDGSQYYCKKHNEDPESEGQF